MDSTPLHLPIAKFWQEHCVDPSMFHEQTAHPPQNTTVSHHAPHLPDIPFHHTTHPFLTPHTLSSHHTPSPHTTRPLLTPHYTPLTTLHPPKHTTSYPYTTPDKLLYLFPPSHHTPTSTSLIFFLFSMSTSWPRTGPAEEGLKDGETVQERRGVRDE